MRRAFIALSLIVAVGAAAYAAENLTLTIPGSWGNKAAAAEPVLLSATGTARVAAMPDRVVISATIYTQDKKAGKAFQDNQYRMSQLMDSLLAMGVPKKNIATNSLSVTPVYGKTYGKAESYVVNRSISIYQDDLDKISPVLDAMIDAGIADIGNIQFVVKEIDAKYREALETAAADCRSTADKLATAMGARIVGLQSLSYSFGAVPVYREMERREAEYGGGMGSAMMENQTIVPAEFTSTVTVNAVYKIEYVGP